jgi:hypothetical protein
MTGTRTRYPNLNCPQFGLGRNCFCLSFQLRGRLQKLAQKTGLESPDYTSPLGSPPGEDSVLAAKGKFLELKRLIQEEK